MVMPARAAGTVGFLQLCFDYGYGARLAYGAEFKNGCRVPTVTTPWRQFCSVH